MYRGVNQYIYIFAVNPKRKAGIDQYRNIPFQWPNRNGCRNEIYNFGMDCDFPRSIITSPDS